MRKKKGNQKNLIAQGGIMASALLFTDLVMIFKQIPLTNLVSDRGNSVYASCYELFFVLWLISGYAVPCASAPMMQTRIRQGQYRNAGRVLGVSFAYAIIMGAAGSLCMVLGGQYIAGDFLMEPLSGFAMLFAAPAMLFGALSGSLRGYFQGNGSPVPTACSMIIETVVMLVTGSFGAKLMSDYGKKTGALLQNDQYAGAFGVAGFMIGISVGALFSFLFLVFLFLVSRSYFKRLSSRDSGRRQESIAEILPGYFMILLPVILYGLFFRGYLLIDQLMFAGCMDGSLSAADISRQWGVYYGKYKVFTSIPVVLAVGMGYSLQTRVRALQKREIYQHLRDHVELVLHAVMVVVMPLSIMIGALAEPVLHLLYPGQESEPGAEFLLTGCVTAILFSAAFLLAEILRGLRKTKIMLLCGIVSFAIHIGSLYLMLETFHLDISGVLYADIIYAAMLCILMGAAVQRSCHMRYSLVIRQLPCLIASAVTGVISFLLTKVFGSGLQAMILLLILISGFVIYWIVLILCRGITREVLQSLPGGLLIERVAVLFRLM